MPVETGYVYQAKRKELTVELGSSFLGTTIAYEATLVGVSVSRELLAISLYKVYRVYSISVLHKYEGGITRPEANAVLWPGWLQQR